jgi:hypothetical protein
MLNLNILHQAGIVPTILIFGGAIHTVTLVIVFFYFLIKLLKNKYI